MAAVAIITPCYNSARYIELTIQSILGQTYADWEYVLVDDGSTDATPTILNHYAAIYPNIGVVLQQNQGVAHARNAGVAAANADTRFLLFLDHDDLLYPDALATLVAALAAREELGAVFGAYTLIDAFGSRLHTASSLDTVYGVEGWRVRKQYGVATLGYGHVAAVTPMQTPGQCLIRASVFAQTAGFDQATAPCDDWDMWLQLSRLRPIGVIGNQVLQWRSHAEQTSHKHGLMQAKRRYVYEKFLHLTVNNQVQHAITKVAYPFGMFDLDAAFCAKWAWQSFAKHHYLSTLRYLARGVQYRSRSAAFRVRRVLARGA